MRIITKTQGDSDWLNARVGVPSSSNFDKIVTTKGEPSKQATKYLYTLAGESVAGAKEDNFQSQAMLRGIEMEAEAVSSYEVIKGVETQEIGFCLHDTMNVGASPDRLVGDEGLLEIKCPIISTQVDYLVNGKLLQAYFQQVQGQLFVTGRKWVDLMSYYPGLNPLIIRVERDETFLAALDFELGIFLKELDRITEIIRGKK